MSLVTAGLMGLVMAGLIDLVTNSLSNLPALMSPIITLNQTKPNGSILKACMRHDAFITQQSHIEFESRHKPCSYRLTCIVTPSQFIPSWKKNHTDSIFSRKRLTHSEYRFNKRGRLLITALSLITLGLLSLYQWLYGKTWKLPLWCYKKTPIVYTPRQQAALSHVIAVNRLDAHASQLDPNTPVDIAHTAFLQASKGL